MIGPPCRTIYRLPGHPMPRMCARPERHGGLHAERLLAGDVVVEVAPEDGPNAGAMSITRGLRDPRAPEPTLTRCTFRGVEGDQCTEAQETHADVHQWIAADVERWGNVAATTEADHGMAPPDMVAWTTDGVAYHVLLRDITDEARSLVDAYVNACMTGDGRDVPVDRWLLAAWFDRAMEAGASRAEAPAARRVQDGTGTDGQVAEDWRGRALAAESELNTLRRAESDALVAFMQRVAVALNFAVDAALPSEDGLVSQVEAVQAAATRGMVLRERLRRVLTDDDDAMTGGVYLTLHTREGGPPVGGPGLPGDDGTITFRPPAGSWGRLQPIGLDEEPI